MSENTEPYNVGQEQTSLDLHDRTGWHFTILALLLPQRFHGIHSRGTARGDPGGQHGHRREH